MPNVTEFGRRSSYGHKPTRRECLMQWASGAIGLTLGVPAFAQKPGDENSAISPVETLLFLANHLDKVKLPARLKYHLHTEGSLATPEDLDLSLDLQQSKGARQATVVLPRGPVPLAIEGKLEANPIIPWFLDRDVATMERLTGGQRRHFQRRLRFALAEAQTVDSVTATWSGKQVAAQRVTLQPYLADPQKPRYLKLAAKRYSFTFSNAAPGQLIEIETIIPGPDDDFSKPVLTDTLQFTQSA